MSVQVSPRNYLGFQRPFNNPVTSNLTLHNPTHKPIVVKIKVTSPKAYCVRPNSSRIEPGETLEISVILQPMRSEPPAHAKCKDKFLICSATIPVEKEGMALTEFWSELEKFNKAAIHEHKLRVAYVSDTETIPEDEISQWAGDVSRNDDHHNTGFASPVTSRMMPMDSTPIGTPSSKPRDDRSAVPGLPYPAVPIHVTNVQTQNIPSPIAQAPTQSPVQSPVQPPAHTPAQAPTGPAAQAASIPSPAMLSTPSKPSNAVPKAEINSLSTTIVNTVEDQLAAARAEISNLQKQLGHSDLGQKVKEAAHDVQVKAGQAMQQENIEGYHLTVVLAVAVAAFSIGYLWHIMT